MANLKLSSALHRLTNEKLFKKNYDLNELVIIWLR